MRTCYINDLFSQIKNGRLVVVANIEHPTKRTIVEAGANGAIDGVCYISKSSRLLTVAVHGEWLVGQCLAHQIGNY